MCDVYKQKLSINIQNLLVSTSLHSSSHNNSCSSKMALLLLKFNILLWVFVPSIAPREVIISVIINIIVIIVIINIIASREFLNIPDICHRRHRRRLWRKN